MLPRVPETAVGAFGTVAGVTEFDGSEGIEFPSTLVATTVKVYAVPFVRPVTVQVVAPVVVQVKDPGEDVTVYPVTGEPLLTPAVHDTSADVLPRVAVTAVGFPGTATGVTAAEGFEELDVPTALVAVTVNV